MTKYYVRGSIIWLNYYVDGVRKQKSTKLKDTPKNIKIVTSQIIPALDIKIATGEIYRKKPNTFKYYGSVFLKQIKNHSNARQRKYHHNVLVEHFGSKSIDSITRLDLKNFLNSLEVKTKNPYKTVLIGIFECAVDDDVLSVNPALNIRLPKTKRRVEYYTKEEVNKLLEYADDKLRVYLQIAFNTGLRTGEILGLQLGDFGKTHISVRRTRTDGIIGLGKNQFTERKVPYPSFLLDEVKKIQEDNIFIFGSWDDSRKLAYYWDKVLVRSKVKRLRIYCTRHTFATIILQDSILSINELAGVLGHSSVKTTLEKYASVIKPDTINLGGNYSIYSDVSVTIKKEA